MSNVDTLNAIAIQWFEIISKQSLYAAIMAGFVWATLKLSQPRHPVWAIALWSLVLIRFILPVESAAPWSARTLLERSTENWLMHDFPARQAKQRPLLETEKLAAPSQKENSASVSRPVQQALPLLALSPIPSTPGLNWMAFLFMLWILGAGYFLIQLKKAYTHLSYTLSRARPLDDKPLTQAVELWRATLSVRRSVCLRASADCDGAFTTGVFTPVIVLPETLIERLAERDISAIIGHEMAHIKGLDSLWLSCEHVLRALFFFHPAIWLATSKLDAAREELRDLDMLHAGPVSVQTYASTLLSVLKNQQDLTNAPILAVAMGRTAVRLKARLILIKNATATLRPSRWLIGGATLTLAALILPMSHSAISKTKPPIIIATEKITPQKIPNANATADVNAENNNASTMEWDSENMRVAPTPAEFAEVPFPPESPAPPQPQIHYASYSSDNADESGSDTAETLRDAEQAVAEAEREAFDARERAQDQSTEAREEFADAEREVERAQLELKWARAEAVRATAESQTREKLKNSPELRKKSLVVVDGHEIRCGSGIDSQKRHKIILNGKKSDCTGGLTPEDINNSKHDKGRAQIILSEKATLILNQDKNGNYTTINVIGDGSNINIIDEGSSVSRTVRDAISMNTRKQALTRALASLSRASHNLRASRSSTLNNLQNSGLAQNRIDAIIKSIDQNLANIEQQRANIERDLNS
jgi:beta-lactamase regulating signal transducer with metallopeptidase domain